VSNLPEFRAMKFFIFGVNFAMFLTARLVARGLLRALFRLVPKHLLKFQLCKLFAPIHAQSHDELFSLSSLHLNLKE
jgi:hypothetical protein